MIRVLLVDDHAIVRRGFRLLLEMTREVAVAAEADSGEACLACFDACSPDAVVLDLSMPGLGGIETLKRLRARSSDARVLALSAHDDPIHARLAFQQGALGFLSKRTAPESLLEGLRAVASGRRFIDPCVAQGVALSEFEGSPLDCLSEREFEVFLRLAKGATVPQIAVDLKVSASTIGTHLYNIKSKLDASNQSELTLLALRCGLIEA